MFILLLQTCRLRRAVYCVAPQPLVRDFSFVVWSISSAVPHARSGPADRTRSDLSAGSYRNGVPQESFGMVPFSTYGPFQPFSPGFAANAINPCSLVGQVPQSMWYTVRAVSSAAIVALVAPVRDLSCLGEAPLEKSSMGTSRAMMVFSLIISFSNVSPHPPSARRGHEVAVRGIVGKSIVTHSL